MFWVAVSGLPGGKSSGEASPTGTSADRGGEAVAVDDAFREDEQCEQQRSEVVASGGDLRTAGRPAESADVAAGAQERTVACTNAPRPRSEASGVESPRRSVVDGGQDQGATMSQTKSVPQEFDMTVGDIDAEEHDFFPEVASGHVVVAGDSLQGWVQHFDIAQGEVHKVEDEQSTAALSD